MISDPTDSPQATVFDGISPHDADLARLLAAAWAGEVESVAEILGRRPKLARAHGPDGQTALHVAAQCDDPRVAAMLLAAGADLEAKYGASGHTALSWAVTCNALACARVLARLGNKPDLFCAAGMGAIEDVRAFFDESGALLPGAARTGSSRFAADGARLPCPPESPVGQVSDALCMACRNAQADVVRYLLARRPDLSFRAYLGGTALHWAYFGGSRKVIELLEQAGADPAARDLVLRCMPRAFGICAPANWGFLSMVQKRLAEDPTLANLMDGRTSALHEAAREGRLEIVRLLLDAGADPLLRDGDDKTALDLAATSGHTSIVEILHAANRLS
jgi:ankyrin repeat protein